MRDEWGGARSRSVGASSNARGGRTAARRCQQLAALRSLLLLLGAELLPLRGGVGEASAGVELVTSDRMGNRCIEGGAISMPRMMSRISLCVSDATLTLFFLP